MKDLELSNRLTLLEHKRRILNSMLGSNKSMLTNNLILEIDIGNDELNDEIVELRNKIKEVDDQLLELCNENDKETKTTKE